MVRLGMPSQFRKSVEAQKQIALTADIGSCSSGGALYLINGSDPTLTLSAGPALFFYTPQKANAEHLRVLSMAPQRLRLSRVAPRVLELEVLELPRQSNQFEHLFRAPSHPLQVGQSVDLGELKVQVDAMGGGLFTRARLEFDSDLDHSRSCLMVWKNGRLESIPVPRQGESVSIEHEPGPLGL